jgi:hypothetical protein
MSGRHVVAIGRVRRSMRLAFVGTREVFVFVAVGVALPVGLLLTVPQLTGSGAAMQDAPTCPPDGRTTNCLDPRPATVGSHHGGTWSVGSDRIEVPADAPTLTKGSDVHVLFWNGHPVAVLRADGTVVETLAWGNLYGVAADPLLVAPAWPVSVLVLAWLVLWRRQRPKLMVLTPIALGAAAAGPLAVLGMRLAGYRGLVAGGLTPLGVAFMLAGGVLWWNRRRARLARRTRPRVSVGISSAHFPAQRSDPPVDDGLVAADSASE